MTDTSLTLTGQMPGYTQAWWAILTDRRVPDGALRLYLVIASHCRGHRNVAWPGQKRLCDLTRQSESQLRRNLRLLEECGWLITRRGDRHETNRYMVLMPAPQAVDMDVDEVMRRASDRSPMTGRDRSPMTGEVEEGEVVTPPTPRRRGERRDGPLILDERPDDFDAWWAAYPRKVAKVDAIRAWRKVKNDLPSIDDLLAATAWLARTVQAEHPEAAMWTKYMPYPATFLRGHRWADVTETDTPVTVARRPANCAVCGSPEPGVDCRGARVSANPDLFHPEDDCPWLRP